MLNARSLGQSSGPITEDTGLCCIPCTGTWFASPQGTALTQNDTAALRRPAKRSTSCQSRLNCTPINDTGGSRLRPRHSKYVAPSPQEYRRVLSQYRALRRRECRAGPGVGYPRSPYTIPLLGEIESREEQEQSRCSFHEDEADLCVYPCPYGMISGACPLKTCRKRQGGFI